MKIKVIDLINLYRLKNHTRVEIRKDNWFVLETNKENIPEEIKNKMVCDFCVTDDDKLVVNFSSEKPQKMKMKFDSDGIVIFGPVAQEEKLNEEDFLKIINHFGLENQREYLGKEYQELQDELYKYVVCGDECEMLTEIADVFVLCLQFLFEYGYELKDLKEEINSKVKRTLERMENGFYD